MSDAERTRNDEQLQQVEDALRDSEARSRVLLECISDIVLVLDEELVMRYVSASVTRVLGYAPGSLVGRSCLEIAHPDGYDEFHAEVRAIMADARDRPPRRLQLKHVNGTWLSLETTAASLVGRWDGGSILLTARDVTERDRLEEQARESQRLDGIGRVAGGVAHDFSNILTAIIGFSEVLLDQTTVTAGSRDDLRAIHKAAEHGATLSRQLLAFSSRQILAPKVLDLDNLVAGLQHIIKGVLGDAIALDVTPGSGFSHVKADPGQLEQVLMNLVVNARDAMLTGGTLTIHTGAAVLETAQLKAHPSAPAGAYVTLTVADSGTGMSSDVMARIFDPFYTTKEPGKGTGLGLSTVYGIVQQSGGFIDVGSVPGMGTSFVIHLPAAARAMAPTVHVPQDEPRQHASETILLVEDDAALRLLLSRQLQMNGYEVHVARSGEEGLSIYQALGRPIDLLVSDGVLPRMSGPVMARELTRQQPSLRVLFISGYTDDLLLRSGLTNENESSYLQKPFGLSAFLRAIRSVLDRTVTAGADV